MVLSWNKILNKGSTTFRAFGVSALYSLLLSDRARIRPCYLSDFYGQILDLGKYSMKMDMVSCFSSCDHGGIKWSVVTHEWHIWETSLDWNKMDIAWIYLRITMRKSKFLNIFISFVLLILFLPLMRLQGKWNQGHSDPFGHIMTPKTLGGEKALFWSRNAHRTK